MRTFCSLVALLLLNGVVWAQDSWNFAVSGDSRNCGDIVMPAIAKGAQEDKASFYWHLGDFRAISGIDQDLAAAQQVPLDLPSYLLVAWPDFIDNQLKPFGSMPVFLGIGNHELTRGRTREQYIKQFSAWLNQEPIAEQRRAGHQAENDLRTYYHWRQGGVDFISLDNASIDQFDPAQIEWFKGVLQRAEKDRKVKAVVVGSHAALPDSLASGHSMNDWPTGAATGRQVYADLVQFHSRTKKRVYLLASHTHFFMANVFNTKAKKADHTVLPGWIVGTAGAVRYRLPADAGEADAARTDLYGYLLGQVNKKGEISFAFKEVKPENIPAEVMSRYGQNAVTQCFLGNKSMQVVSP